MAKAAGRGGKARATASPKATAARKSRVQTTANEPETVMPASAATNGAVNATNEPSSVTTGDGDDQPDEEELLADVSAIIDPLVMLDESESTPAAPPAISTNTATPESVSQAAQLMAQHHHAEYQRSVELVRQQLAQRHMQQMQQTQQHLEMQRQQQQLYQQPPSATSTPVTTASVMQHVQQRLHERIQHKELYDQIRQQATSGDAAAQQQLQIQQYHMMIRDLEMQAAAAAVAAASNAASAPSAPANLSHEELERLRQEQLQRLHQMQLQKMQQQQQIHLQAQTQHAAALRVTLTGVPPAAPADQHQQQRAQMHSDLERLRQLHQQQQLLAKAAQAAVATPSTTLAQATSVSTATSAPSKKREAEDITVDKDPNSVTSTTTTMLATTGTPAVATASPISETAPPKKKRKTPSESQMEGLVRVLCRLQLSKNESEMRSQLEKLTTWISKSTDICLLRFALRDFVEIFGVKMKQFGKSPQWAPDLLPKCTFAHDKLRHAIAALDRSAGPTTEQTTTQAEASSQERVPTASAVVTSTTGLASMVKPPTTPGNDGITLAAREHAYAALKEQMLASLVQPRPRASATTKAPAASTGAADVTATSSNTTNTEVVSVSAGANPKETAKTMKRNDLSINVYVDTTPKVAATTSGGSVAQVASSITTAKPIPLLRPAATPAPTTSTIISPQVAQHLFDLNLAPRSCLVAPDEGEDRFYFPTKPIASIMRRILPGGGPPPVRRRRKRGRYAADTENANDSVAKKKNEDEDEEDEDADDAEGDGGADEGDDNEVKDGDDDEVKGEKESEQTSGNRSMSSTATPAAVSDESPVKIDDDALTFMQECVTEFMLFFTSEARDQAAYERKKGSITGLNLIHALENLGFSPYAKVLANYNDKVRKVQDEAAHQKQERKNLAKARKLQAERELKQREEEEARKAAALTVPPQVKSEASTTPSDATAPVALTPTSTPNETAVASVNGSS